MNNTKSFANDSRQGLILLLSGLPGTGKSTIARRVAHELGRAVSIFSTDRIRKELYREPTYSDEENLSVHATTRKRIRNALLKNRIVIHDATNLLEVYRQWAFDIADETNSHALVAILEVDETLVKQRLDQRATHGSSWSDADWSVYQLLKATAEPAQCPHILIKVTGQTDAADISSILDGVNQLLYP